MNYAIGAYAHNLPQKDVPSIKRAIVYKLIFTLGVNPDIAKPEEWLNAAMFAVRDLITEDMLHGHRTKIAAKSRMVYYLSMEYLPGRAFVNSLINQNVYDAYREAFRELGLDFDRVIDQEEEPGLGNGGLGRLAACFLDSMATLNIPAIGYGIRYQYGMFKQDIVAGQQVECPDMWLDHDMSWQFPRPGRRYNIRFGGAVHEEQGRRVWHHNENVSAIACDDVIPGYGNASANFLRLWTAHAGERFDLVDFNKGEYFAAMAIQTQQENVSRVLYPDDSTTAGKELRLRQEYFLISASVQDIVYRHKRHFGTLDSLAEKVAIHLNDTHPVLAIPELMYILVDQENIPFDQAWNICGKIFSYTNHTLMGEALETWPVDMLGRILPRHLEIILKINEGFLKQVARDYPGDIDLIRRVSLIDEERGRRVRMAWLAVIGSHKVNGVAKIHSELMQTSVFADFARIFPKRFTNVTNGVTPRRWISVANRKLTVFLDDVLETKDWRVNLGKLDDLNAKVDDPDVQRAFAAVKRANKERLCGYILNTLDISVDPGALFDVQIKRIHEYKRQMLNLLHIIDRYNRIVHNPDAAWQPRVFIFAGKAASAYHAAKMIIRLIHDVAQVINGDSRVRDLIKVVFLPNYSVSLAQIIIPAADLSEQISLAGTEASGTGNMKFALNGALTIGTLDGANVEILEHVGKENIFIFGHTVDEVAAIRQSGYDPLGYVDKDPQLRQVLRQITTGVFSPQELGRYASMTSIHGDYYQILADFRSYVDCQNDVDGYYRNQNAWLRSALINIANMGYFSSDRSIAQYARDIWAVSAPGGEETVPAAHRDA